MSTFVHVILFQDRHGLRNYDTQKSLSMQKSTYYDLFISFHGSEELGYIKTKPQTRAFIKDFLIPEIRKKWKDDCKRQGKLSIFFDDYEINNSIADDIFSAILCLRVMVLK